MGIRIFLLLAFLIQGVCAPVLLANSAQSHYTAKKNGAQKLPLEKKEVKDTDDESDTDEESKLFLFHRIEFDHLATKYDGLRFDDRQIISQKTFVFAPSPIIIWVQNFRI